MALPVYAKQGEIPKGFEEEYEQHDDNQWHPIDHVGKLSKALKEEREKREAAEGVASKAAREAAAAAARASATASGMTAEAQKELYDKIEANVRAEYEPKLKELETVTRENRDFKLKNNIVTMFEASGAQKKRVDDFWKLHGDEFDLTSDGKPMVKAEPGKDVLKHVQGITKARNEWTVGTKASGGGAGGSTQTTPMINGTAGGATFEDIVKNPRLGLEIANA